MKIVVTGAAGFIGAAVAEALLGRGDAVLGVDNMNDYYDPRLKEWRLEKLRLNKAFSFEKADVADRGRIDGILKNFRPEAVINLAARAGVRPSLENPRLYYETNVLGTLNLLEACRHQGIRTFVLASTSSVYGEGATQFSESLPTDRPVSPYAASKKAAEVLAFTYHNQFGLDATVLRYFTVYGPAGRPDMAAFRFIANIDGGKPITVYGDGKQRRDFTYIADIARGTLQALSTKGYHIINLGNNSPIELNQLIEMIEKSLAKKATIERKPRHPADVLATWADVRVAEKVLGWRPMETIEGGLKKTIEWYFEHRDFALSLLAREGS
jgi:UDP-glucuronate 4-epimerase